MREWKVEEVDGIEDGEDGRRSGSWRRVCRSRRYRDMGLGEERFGIIGSIRIGGGR